MKSLLIAFGAILLTIALPFIFTATEDAQVEELTQSYAEVATAVNVTAANVTLGTALYGNDTTSVNSVGSNITADTPTAATYNTASRALELSGLGSNTTRTISVTYEITSTTMPDGAGAVIGLIRWLVVFSIVGLFGGAIYAFFD